MTTVVAVCFLLLPTLMMSTAGERLPLDQPLDPRLHASLRTGVVLEKLTGDCVPVTSYVVLHVPLNLVSDIQERLMDIWDAAKTVAKHLRMVRRTPSNTYGARLERGRHQDFISELHGILMPFLPEGVLSDRSKRSACDFCGTVFSWMTGVVTEARLRRYGEGVNDALLAQQVVIKRTLNETSLIKDKVNEVISSLKNITRFVNQKFSESETQIMVILDDVKISNMMRQARSLANLINNFALDIVLAASGKVNPSLIPIQVLSRVIDEVVVTKQGLSPLFSNYMYYYPVLKGTVIESGICISIPFRPVKTYSAYKFHPFPTYVHGKLIVLTHPLVGKVVLHASDTNSYITLTEAQFNSCTYEKGLYVCQDTAFVERPVRLGSCVAHLLGDVTHDSVHACSYVEVDNNWVTDVRVRGHTFLYFPQPILATVKCNGSVTRKTLQGSYVLPTNCSMDAQNSVKVPAIMQYNKPLEILVPNITPLHELVSYPNSTLPRDIALLDDFDTSYPEFHPMHLVVGSVGTLSTIIVVSLILLFFYCRHRRGWYSTAKRPQHIVVRRDVASTRYNGTNTLTETGEGGVTGLSQIREEDDYV